MVEAFAGTETVSTTEWSLTTDTAGPDVETSDGEFRIMLDLNALAAGDVFELKIYEKAQSSDTQRVFWSCTFSGVQAVADWQSPRTFSLMHGWDVTLKKLSGTDRTITWSIREVSQQSATAGLATAAALATVQSDTDDIQTRLPAALVDGRMSAIVQLQTGTAQAGAAKSITLATSASTTADLYRGLTVAITSGTGAGQARRIVAYSVGRVATVDEPWVTNPDNTSVYALVPSSGIYLDSAGVVVSDAGNTAATFKTDLAESSNDHFNDAFLVFMSGSLRGQVHKVTDYDGTSKFITFTSPSVFTAAPAAGDAFLLINK